ITDRCGKSPRPGKKLMTLQEEQARIDRRIASALIEATPESWDAAEMSVRRTESHDAERMEIEIANPKALHDPVGPTEEIYVALYARSDCFRAHGAAWRDARYSVSLKENGEWAFQAASAY